MTNSTSAAPSGTARVDGRGAHDLRTVSVMPGFMHNADGSVLWEQGGTRVICTASVADGVPKWREGSGKGWVTAEYSMLPASTGQRKPRDSARGKVDGRSTEIQRLIGRSLRMAVDVRALGERTVTIDCDVLDADGGTRCAAICGGYAALHIALDALVARGELAALPLLDPVVAISVGIVGGQELVDLAYVEDSSAELDMNVVATAQGQLIEVQATAESAPVDRARYDQLLDAALTACGTLATHQRAAWGA